MDAGTAEKKRPAILACPNCGGALRREGLDFCCSSCGRMGTSLTVPCFADPDFYWGEISREEVRRMNAVAAEQGWETAVDQVIHDRKMRRYISDRGRADFQYLWDLPADSTILDVGAGLGAVTAGLSATFAHVVAVEGVLDRARFIHHRMRASPERNVEVICADFMRLPLAEGQFDAVVLNGVVEWVGLASPEGNPRDLQVRFLRRMRDLLKPSGLVCVGIENRVGWSALRYGTDHSGIRYTSLMPRKLADMWCRLRAPHHRSPLNRGYRTYTFGLGGYRKLFREAGFTRVRAFHAWNGYNDPKTLLPLDNRTALARFAGHLDVGPIRRKTLELSARSGLWAHMASEFIFLLEKP